MRDDRRSSHPPLHPAVLLARIRLEEGENWYIHAADLKKHAYFQPNTKNVCAERDFMRVETNGHPPDKLEKELSKFETKAREAILRIEQSHTFQGEERETVLNLMALFAVRYPQLRENMRDFQERIIKQVMNLTLATKERWEGQLDQAEAAGKDVRRNVSYEQMKEFHERGEYKVNVKREFQITSELKALPTVLNTFAGRKWKLFYAGQDEGLFITSDHPVVVTWNNPHKIPQMMRHSPGFGMIDTEVIFPLTRTCCLMGRFEGMEEGVEEALGGLIAACNTRTFSHAFYYAFMFDKRTPYFVPPHEGYFDDQFMQRAKAYKDQNPPQEEINIEWNVENGPAMPRSMKVEKL